MRQAAQVYNPRFAVFYPAEPPREFETMRYYRRGTPTGSWRGPARWTSSTPRRTAKPLLEIAELDGTTPRPPAANPVTSKNATGGDFYVNQRVALPRDVPACARPGAEQAHLGRFACFEAFVVFG